MGGCINKEKQKRLIHINIRLFMSKYTQSPVYSIVTPLWIIFLTKYVKLGYFSGHTWHYLTVQSECAQRLKNPDLDDCGLMKDSLLRFPFEIQHCWGSEAWKADALQSHRPRGWCASLLFTLIFRMGFSAALQGSATRVKVSSGDATLREIHGVFFWGEIHAWILCLQCCGVTHSTWSRQMWPSSRRRSAKQERTMVIWLLKTCFVPGALIGARMPARWEGHNVLVH